MFRLLLQWTTLLGCLCFGGLPLLQATEDFTALDQGISGAHVVVDAIAPTTAGGLYVGGTFATINVTGSSALTANNVVLVPIRSGVGLRLGANVGYLKFTPASTWNPF